jgi:hypothetical protein
VPIPEIIKIFAVALSPLYCRETERYPTNVYDYIIKLLGMDKIRDDPPCPAQAVMKRRISMVRIEAGSPPTIANAVNFVLMTAREPRFPPDP